MLDSSLPQLRYRSAAPSSEGAFSRRSIIAPTKSIERKCTPLWQALPMAEYDRIG